LYVRAKLKQLFYSELQTLQGNRVSILDAKVTKSKYGGPSFSMGHRLTRLAWSLSWTVFASWTPTPLHGWRRFLLRLFGAKIGRGAHIYSSARIWYPRNLIMDRNACIGPRVDCYSMARITIGVNAVVSQNAELCAGTHDVGDAQFHLIAKPITIGDHAWVASGAFVGPGITIGEGAVLGARAVAFKDIAPWEIHVGNPARFLRRREMTKTAMSPYEGLV
jgi:putative colanic acid biosynthesis acetyltransferase WcaF